MIPLAGLDHPDREDHRRVRSAFAPRGIGRNLFRRAGSAQDRPDGHRPQVGMIGIPQFCFRAVGDRVDRRRPFQDAVILAVQQRPLAPHDGVRSEGGEHVRLFLRAGQRIARPTGGEHFHRMHEAHPQVRQSAGGPKRGDHPAQHGKRRPAPFLGLDRGQDVPLEVRKFFRRRGLIPAGNDQDRLDIFLQRADRPVDEGDPAAESAQVGDQIGDARFGIRNAAEFFVGMLSIPSEPAQFLDQGDGAVLDFRAPDPFPPLAERIG